ncbi:replication factor C subunit 1, partial [Pancytospora epiphaga]
AKIDLYFEDYTFIPLFIHENYVKCKMGFETLCLAADSISFGDVQDARIHGSGQDWSVMPYHAFSSCVCPTRGLSMFSRIDFPAYLGQMSKMGKNRRILSMLQRHCKFKIDSHCWRYYVMPLLDTMFMCSMANDDFGKALSLLVETDLLKDDIITINSLVTDSYKSIPTKSKTAFTREYNKLKRTLPYSLVENTDKDGESEE